MISGCQRYIVEVRDLGTFIRDPRDPRDLRTEVRIFTDIYWPGVKAAAFAFWFKV